LGECRGERGGAFGGDVVLRFLKRECKKKGKIRKRDPTEVPFLGVRFGSRESLGKGRLEKEKGGGTGFWKSKPLFKQALGTPGKEDKNPQNSGRSLHNSWDFQSKKKSRGGT